MSQVVHIGTSGWSYADWVGPFYPAGTPPGDYLARYAQHFDVVEVDSTYYRPPGRQMVQNWAGRTPAHFRFALKAPGEITHKKVLHDCDAEMEVLLEALEPLRAKTLCVLWQFGYFNRKAFASATPFFEQLAAFLVQYAGRTPLAVEIRNKQWLSADYFDLLRRHGAAAALVEHSWLPRIDRLIEEHDVITAPFSYCRLIGDRKGIEQVTETWDRPVVDRTEDLTRVAAALRRIAQRVPVYTFANNHYAGHGPDTCRRLRELIDRR